MITQRRELTFDGPKAVKAEIRSLDASGYTQAGQWSLAQICAHLNTAMNVVLASPPHAETTPEQLKNRPVLESMLASGKMVDGLVAPEAFVPAPTSGANDINAFLATLDKFAAHPGPFAPHRRFGRLPEDQIRRLQMFHCAHHLGFLSPK